MWNAEGKRLNRTKKVQAHLSAEAANSRSPDEVGFRTRIQCDFDFFQTLTKRWLLFPMFIFTYAQSSIFEGSWAKWNGIWNSFSTIKWGHVLRAYCYFLAIGNKRAKNDGTTIWLALTYIYYDKYSAWNLGRRLLRCVPIAMSLTTRRNRMANNKTYVTCKIFWNGRLSSKHVFEIVSVYRQKVLANSCLI